jgi:ABC-2 type transport system ATP-binding protein
MNTVIQTKGLTKVFKRVEKEDGLKGTLKALFKRVIVEKTALDHFDFQVEQGELLGLIGPNGAGKTTLVKLLCGIIQPSAGEAQVLGFTPGKLKDGFRRSYAVVMGQKSQLWWDLPASDTFLLNKEIYGIPDDIYKQNIAYFSDIFGVRDLLSVPVRNLSLGERMKMELMAALLHNPKILFLDEPTIGLDAIAQKQIRLFLKEVNETKGVTIMLTSHYMEDIKHLCKRTVVINGGKKVYDGNLDALLSSFQEHRIITVSFECECQPQLDLPVEWLEKSPLKSVLMVRRELVKPVIQSLLTHYEVNDIRIEEEDIGGVIERIYTAGKEGIPL